MRVGRGFSRPAAPSNVDWRLEMAKHLLSESRKNIAEIANALGYDSEEGFRRAFRRAFAMAPTDWRDRHYITAPRTR